MYSKSKEHACEGRRSQVGLLAYGRSKHFPLALSLSLSVCRSMFDIRSFLDGSALVLVPPSFASRSFVVPPVFCARAYFVRTVLFVCLSVGRESPNIVFFMARGQYYNNIIAM